MQNLTGKVAFVTGGSRGIGAAIAKRLARDGATVALTYVSSPDRARDVVGEIEAAGGTALAIKADNRNAEEIEAAVNQAAAQFGQIDILVNNAGIIEFAPIDEFSIEQFDRTVDVNVRAVFVATKAALAHMPDGGRIISTGSNLAHRVPWPGLSLYALSKSALIGFTRGVARDLGPRKITVNVVHPGPTETDMNPAEGDIADVARSVMAIPDYSDADDTAGLVAWLSGPEAKVVTGSEFTVDSGMNA
ncbi:3-oxoacyl-ACP reductase family protein [Thalassospira lohafexi]|uniref:Oxidoreductase n=1 Tax=Thalassospira lohafexi TaxID=744227 RepID=A0A2N3LAT0_9PROT|nr:3-oxoacyl-ACP reductase family protein [Thalassospira lohafexi]PKR59902.1 oxidoreductase [Thalassospira lohafexi]